MSKVLVLTVIEADFQWDDKELVVKASDYDQLKAENDALMIQSMHRGEQLLTLRKQLDEAQAIIDQQAARIAELQKDADRYRWLEANSTYGIDYRQRQELTLPIYAPDHRDGLDAAIDAAIRSGESK